MNELEDEGVEVEEFVARSLSLPFIINKAPRLHEARNELLIGSGRCRPSTMTAGVDGHALDQSTRLKNIMEHRQCYNEPFIPPSGIFGHDISLNRRAVLFFWYAQVRVLLVFWCV